MKISLTKFLPLNSVRFKVSVLYTVVLGVILMIFSTVLYLIISYHLFQDEDTTLKLKANEVLANVTQYRKAVLERPGSLEFAVRKTLLYGSDFPLRLGEAGKIKGLDTRWHERAQGLGLPSSYELFFSASGQVIKSRNVPVKLLPQFIKIVQSAPHKDVAFRNLTWGKNVLRVVTVPYPNPGGNAHVLLLAVVQTDVAQLLKRFLQAAALGIPLVLVLTSFMGFIFARRILDPIEEIARTANQITYKDLSSRVKVDHADVEIEYLVASFNDMISRLEKSFKHINEFSSQVAHELKTPLAIIRGETELALAQERSKEEYQHILRINLEETHRMRKTVEDLLLLTRLDYQPEVFKFQNFEFGEFFQEIYEQAQLLASDRGLQLNAVIPKTKAQVTGDKLHLRRMFFNIIDNAFKFTPAPGQIRMQVAYAAQNVQATISDTGVGIPENELPRIFDKFYHYDRTGRTDGSTGLGLSIVQSIVRSHKGSIRVASKVNSGTTFNISLPIREN